jgi:hypothetical protein
VSDGIGGRFARWSQRKQAARRAARGTAAPVAREDARAVVEDAETKANPLIEEGRPAEPAEVVQARTEQTDMPGEARPALPSLEELDANSDYTPFLAKDVPEALARAALRKLWLSDPIFANLDGLNDYDLDYNLIDQAITSAQTSYKVGRGHLGQDADEVSDDIAGDCKATAAKDDAGDDRQRESADIAADNESAAGRESGADDEQVKLSRTAVTPDQEEPGEAGPDGSADTDKISKA